MMDYPTFEQLVAKVKGCFFASSKRDAINKSFGNFTAQQIYRLQGQFTSGNDRAHVVTDLNTSKRILPMTAVDAEPVIKMGIYSGQRKDILKALAPHIVDRAVPNSRVLIARNFSGLDGDHAMRLLDQAGPYEGPPPVATIGHNAAIVSTNVVLVNPGSHYSIDPVSTASNAIFGGIFTADAPAPTQRVVSAVTYPTCVQPGQQIVYPAAQPTAAPQAAAPATPYHPNMYPSLPTQPQPYTPHPSGPPANLPPYTPVDPNAHSQVPPQYNTVQPTPEKVPVV